MDSIKDLLGKKADQIDLQTKKDALVLVQEVLDRHFPGHTRAAMLQRERLTVKVTSPSMASEVRLSQLTLIEEINRLPDILITRLVIRH